MTDYWIIRSRRGTCKIDATPILNKMSEAERDVLRRLYHRYVLAQGEPRVTRQIFKWALQQRGHVVLHEVVVDILEHVVGYMKKFRLMKGEELRTLKIQAKALQLAVQNACMETNHKDVRLVFCTPRPDYREAKLAARAAQPD